MRKINGDLKTKNEVFWVKYNRREGIQLETPASNTHRASRVGNFAISFRGKGMLVLPPCPETPFIIDW